MWAAHDGMGWWMLFGGVVWVVVIVSLVYLFSRGLDRRPYPPERPELPLDIARRRLAAGEISHDEYERIRETLSR